MGFLLIFEIFNLLIICLLVCFFGKYGRFWYSWPFWMFLGSIWKLYAILCAFGKNDLRAFDRVIDLRYYKFKKTYKSMAKLKSLIKIEGTMEDLTFYKNADGYFVRTKGGVSKNRIMNDPAFARTRENGEEFGSIAGSGKLLRAALGPMVFRAKDSKLTSRLVKVLGQIKNMDTTSIRGKRNVAEGLNDAAAKAMLEGFDFNVRATMSAVMNAIVLVDVVTGTISISSFDPLQQMRSADGATHFSLQAGFLQLDFSTGAYELTQSDEIVYPLVPGVITPVLTPNEVPTLGGVSMHVLLIEFFQEVNGVRYLLNNGAFNVLNLVKVN